MTRLLENDLVECMGCHHVWDGFSQCPCIGSRIFYNDGDDEHNNKARKNTLVFFCFFL